MPSHHRRLGMDWPTAAELLQRAPADPTTDPAAAAASLRWLGRFGRIEALRQRAEALRRSTVWSARWALELAVALRLAGAAPEADTLILEADRLQPALRLVPDRWGLWPAPGPSGEDTADGRVARDLLESLVAWRWLDAATLEPSCLEQAAASWQQGLDDAALDQLALLLHQGDGPSEPFHHSLIRIVGDAEMAAHPGPAAAFWGFLADAEPSWDFAVIKAAELALQQGRHQRCAAWLREPAAALAANPWCHDLSARLALEEGRISDALSHWGEAIARCSGDDASSQPQLLEVFRQRRREARRGPGLLQARALIDRGDAARAHALLQELVEQDPQWQPLRALLAQVEQAAATASPSGHDDGRLADPEVALAQFSGFLERIARQRDLTLPPLVDSTTGDLDSQRQCLEAFAAHLGEAEGQLALRG